MFIFDCECHMLPSTDDLRHFPLYKQNRQALINLVRRLEPKSIYNVKEIRSFEETRKLRKRRIGYSPGESADALIEVMDNAGVSMACVLPESMLPMTGYTRMESTNGWLANEIEKYPDRLVGVCNVGPMIHRGVKNAIWELEYLIKEKNFKAVKFYPVDDTPINNKELWPYYEKIQELGVPVFIHTGFSYCIPGRSNHANPWLLEDVCEDFPDLTILAYHLGYPFCEALNMCALKYSNLYIGTSLLPYFGRGMSRKAQKLIGDAIMWAGSKKLIWGTDLGANKDEVDILSNFQISEEVQEAYGYDPISQEDRENWAGLNLARVLNITPKTFKNN